MNNDGFFAVWPDIETRQRLNMMTVILGLDLDQATDYHVTLMYDPNNTETSTIEIPIRAYTCAMKDVALYNGSLVIELESEDLNERHQELVDAGKVSNYPKYRPHVTLIQDVGTEAQVEFLKPYIKQDKKPLVFGNETSNKATN